MQEGIIIYKIILCDIIIIYGNKQVNRKLPGTYPVEPKLTESDLGEITV